MKRFTLAVLLALLAAPLFANAQEVKERELTTGSDPWANDHNFIAPPQ